MLKQILLTNFIGSDGKKKRLHMFILGLKELTTLLDYEAKFSVSEDK